MSERPIFIVGCERSGTTLLRLMLHAHPRIALPPQTKFLKKLYKRRLLFGDLNRENNRRKLAAWFMEHFDGSTKLVDLGLESAVIRAAVLSAPGTFGSAMGAVFQAYAHKWGRPRWGDKRPYYLKYLKQIFRLFPNAQVIHLVRDGRDCVASLKNMPWWHQGTTGATINWIESIRLGDQARQRYRPDQFTELRYEDLIDRPETKLQELCAFLDEEYTPAMLDFSTVAKETVPEYKLGWHGSTRQGLNRNAIGRWRRDLEPWELALVETMASKELLRWDYATSGQNNRLPAIKRLRFYNQTLKWRLERFAEKIFDALITLFYPWPLASRLDRD